MAKVMILGSGGREHALAWWFRQYKHDVSVAPGNFGTQASTTLNNNIPLDLNDFEAVKAAVQKNGISLVVVGPEVPLVHEEGIAAYWREKGDKRVKVFAPYKEGAMLEGSKIFGRTFARNHSIPIPDFYAFQSGHYATNLSQLETFIKSNRRKKLQVLKADGLCAGKGVFVEDSSEGVIAAAKKLAKFGDAGEDFILEERLSGPEFSVIVMTDGKSYKLFPDARDHKRRFDCDKGPNTGGMGAYAPTGMMTPDLERKIGERIIRPTIEGLQADGIEYRGILYFAIMLHKKEPYLLEYNCRFGDPEAQAILQLVNADPYTLMRDCLNGNFEDSPFKVKNEHACSVVLCHENYPENSSSGEVIDTDILKLQFMQDVIVFHSGTKADDKGRCVTNGGRILNVATSKASLERAVNRVYEAVNLIKFNGMAYRTDIGRQLQG